MLGKAHSALAAAAPLGRSLVGSWDAGQGREVRPVSQNLERWPALEKLLRMPRNRRNQCRFRVCMPCTHGSAALGMLSGILITRVRGEVIRGMQWGDGRIWRTQTWLPLSVPTVLSQGCFRWLKSLSVHLVATSSSLPQNASHSSRLWCIEPLCLLFPLCV